MRGDVRGARDGLTGGQKSSCTSTTMRAGTKGVCVSRAPLAMVQVEVGGELKRWRWLVMVQNSRCGVEAGGHGQDGLAGARHAVGGASGVISYPGRRYQ